MELFKCSVGAPNSDEVTVEHRAIGLNYIDIYQRTGLYPLELPTALGVEGSGIVTEVGDSVEHLNIGDRVAYASARPGAYSDMRNLDATQVCKLPEDVSFKVGDEVGLCERVGVANAVAKSEVDEVTHVGARREWW